MMKMGFQHSQPQSVYRQKNRALVGLLVPVSLGMLGVYGYQFLDRPRAGSLFVLALWLFNLVNSIQMFIRTRLTMSPAGISITTTFGRTLSTAWANVERIQLIRLGFGIKSDVPCLVLRQPGQGQRWLGPGVPAELKGRLIPIYPSAWERMFTLEEELYRYIPANPAGQGQLSVPINFAASGQQMRKLTKRILIPVALLMALQLLVVLYIIWR
jgi:hypothetical protein